LTADKKKKDEAASATTTVIGSDGEERQFHEITFKPTAVPVAKV